MADRGVDTVSYDWVTPFGGDGFSRVTGLTISDFVFAIVAPDGEDLAITEVADDDRADSAVLRGQMLFKEIGSSGTYRMRWRVGTTGAGAAQTGTWWLTAEYAARSVRWEIEHDAVLLLATDPAASEKVVLKARTPDGAGVPHVAYDITTSAGVRVLTGHTLSTGDADLFLPVGSDYKARLSAADWQFAEATFTVVAGSNPDLTVTASSGSLTVVDLTPISIKLADATIEVEFRRPVSGALIDPNAVSQLEILDTDGSTVLETIASGSITKVSTGRYKATASGATLDAAGAYYHRWTYTIDSGDSPTVTTKSWTVVASVQGGLTDDNLCTVTGTFTLVGGKPAANVTMVVRYTAAILVAGKLVTAAGVSDTTNKDGQITTKIARGAKVRAEIRRLGIDKTVTIPAGATGDWAALLA